MNRADHEIEIKAFQILGQAVIESLIPAHFQTAANLESGGEKLLPYRSHFFDIALDGIGTSRHFLSHRS